MKDPSGVFQNSRESIITASTWDENVSKTLFQNSQNRRKLLPENRTLWRAPRRAKTATQTRCLGSPYAHVAAHKHHPSDTGRAAPGRAGFSAVFQALFQTPFHCVLEHMFSR